MLICEVDMFFCFGFIWFDKIQITHALHFPVVIVCSQAWALAPVPDVLSYRGALRSFFEYTRDSRSTYIASTDDMRK